MAYLLYLSVLSVRSSAVTETVCAKEFYVRYFDKYNSAGLCDVHFWHIVVIILSYHMLMRRYQIKTSISFFIFAKHFSEYSFQVNSNYMQIFVDTLSNYRLSYRDDKIGPPKSGKVSESRYSK